MGRKLLPALVAGAVLWGILTVACSSAMRGPAPGGADWGGTIAGAEGGTLRGRPLAWGWDKNQRIDVLYRVNPRTMQLRDPFPLDTKGTMAADLSPDNLLLMATAKDGAQVIDLDTMRRTATVDAGLRWVREAFWLDDDVAVFLVDVRDKTRLVRLQPSTGRILGRESFRGTFFATADTGDGVVVLTHDYDSEETPSEPLPATLAVMDAAGNFATVRLDEVGAGFYEGPEGEGTARALPAVAVRDSVATVIGTDGTIVSVDLGMLEVTVEGKDASLFDRIAAWFVPPAHAKTFDGTELRAEWAGDDALLVSGYRTAKEDTRPLGAVLLDPDDWSPTTVDEEAYGARMAGDRLLTWKTFMLGDDRGEGIGLRAYGPDGELEWQALDGEFVRLQTVHRNVAYVEHGWAEIAVSSVDLATGEVLATRYKHVNFLHL